MVDKSLVERVVLAELFLGHKLYPYQIDLFSCPAIKRLIVKARQVGISTLVSLEALVDCTLNSNYTVLLLSIDERRSNKILDEIRGYLKNFVVTDGTGQIIPAWLDLIGDKDKQDELRFSNGSRILSLTSNPSNARGFTANHVVLDEFASMVDIDEILASCLPTLSRGGRLTIVSTPKGKKSKLYQLWIESNDYSKFEIPYTECPDLTEDRIEPIKKELSAVPGLFESEYCCSFETYVGSIFNIEELEDLETEDYNKEGLRIISWDPARIKDLSTVLCLQKKGEKKTVIMIDEISNLPYPDQARKVMDYATLYDCHRIVIDAGGVGQGLIDHLKPMQSRLRKFLFSPKLKQELAIRIKSDISKGNISFVRNRLNEKLFRDMSIFSLEDTRFKRLDRSHGDYLASLMLAYSELKKQDNKIRVLNTNFGKYRKDARIGIY